MRMKVDKIFLSKMLIVLLVINYMIITIILKDNFILKYARDALLLVIFASSLPNYKKIDRNNIGWVFFIILAILTLFISDSFGLAIISMRKYIFSIMMFLLGEKFLELDRSKFEKMVVFLLVFMSFVSAWGVFQAWILGDEFLKKIGYAVSYKYGYGREMLNYSFYFGGLGIQRVVSTLSNSNVCGLLLGMSLIMGVYFYPFIKYKNKKLALSIITLGYILTFSRSNFLAMGIVILLLMYPFIPKKKTVLLSIFLLVMVLCIIGIIQGNSGLIYKIWNWIVSSVNMKEDSVAGRSSIWKDALNEVIKNPQGLGYGHAGAIARDASVVSFYACENSYLAMALDFGIVGVLLYIFNLILLYRYFNKKPKSNFDIRVNRCAKSILIYVMVIFFFSNHIYDMEAIGIILFYLGLMINVKKSNLCNEDNYEER